MASGEDGYYYIINKETGKYLKKTGKAGDNNTIQVADYASADDVKFKFSFATPSGITEGSWVIYPKDNSDNDKTGWVSKQSGNIVYVNWLKSSIWNNQPVGDLNSQWNVVARANVQWPKSGLPFEVSTSSDKHYYRINHAQSTGYNISYDGSNNVTISTELDNKTAWYFEEAATDANIDNLKYYYIVNAETGKYLKFTAITINGSNQDDMFVLSDYDAVDADRFQFVVVNSIGGNAGYSIMPKLAMSNYGVNKYANSMVPASVSNNEKLDLRSDRNNNNAHWNFVPTEYPMSCAITGITYSSSTGKITISASPSGADIRYTLDGTTEPSASVGTSYSEPFDVSSTVTIKAIATKTGYDDSEIASATFTQVATPTIQNNGSNAISITSATEGVTIYYTTDGSTPTTSSTQYTGPLPENVSGVTIKAIAVKDGFINSAVASGSVTLKCARPVIAKSGDNVTISCAFPATGVTIYYTKGGSTPTSSSTKYTSAIPVEIGDVVKAIAIASGFDNSDIATKTILKDLTPTDGKYLINNQSDFEVFVDMAGSEDGASYHYVLNADVTAGLEISEPFTGTFDGGYHTISGLSHAIFNSVDGGVVRNVMLSGVSISSSDESVGAIAGVAKGYSRIYNCGILPNDATFPEGTHPSVSTTGSCAGGIVGTLQDDSRVVNCFSYADVSSSGTAAGIVGHNAHASTAAVTDDRYADLRTMVVNCMNYGNVSASTVYPVYGGTKITNAGDNAINNYNYYSVGCTFSTANGKPTDYNCSWPVQLDYLTRYEFIRSQLNSNRELCGWWVGAPSAPSSMTTAEVQAVPKDASLMAKWVLDPSVAPYPILKPFGYYPSPVNIDADASWRETANEWEGKKLGTLHVTVNAGDHGLGSTSLDIPITDMDTLHADYCYRKIQLPYYNAVFGNPDGADWTARYGGNYTDYVVTGWDITTSQGTAGTLEEDWQDGYNFADRNCTVKDTKRTFAQGGYYYVPNSVENITITAHWGKAIYLGNGDNYYDRVDFKHVDNKPGTAFTPAGTRSATLGNGETVQTGKIATVAAGFTSGETVTVYDNALVLVGNHQYCTGGEDVNPSRRFTIMSADFDFDNEPDYCLDWQLGVGTTRQSICPIRFDFLPVVEIGLGLKKDGSTQYYSLGCYRPLGHFEVTETALIRFGQFEFSNKNRKNDAPIILNGGIYDQYTKGTNGNAFSGPDDPITYIIIGGNVYLPTFSPGAHVNTNAAFRTRHCAVNVIGGRIDNLYLTGNYNDGVTPNKDNPHCYIDGGRFKQVAAAGKEGIDGDVTFKINHAAIWEFYGGGTLADKRVTGSIDVTIDNSRVTKYCGGPKFGDMYDGKTVTTQATGTTFGVYYGGGNGGTSYVQYDKTDGEQKVSGFNWGTTGKLNNYSPGTYRNEDTGYMADYDLTITNVSTGTNAGNAIYRSYFYAAQFSATNTGPITNTLKDCTVLTDFYGGGNLGGVIGDVTSTLKGETKVLGSAFGAGFSASIPEVTIREKDKTPPSIDVNTGIITPQGEATSNTYTWTNETSLGGKTLSTRNPAVKGVGGKNYFFTEKSLVNLGAVTGNVTLTVEGNTTVEGKVYDADGNVVSDEVGGIFGGGNESTVTGNTTVTLQGNADVWGSVYGGGNKGKVSGSATVNIIKE